eukprot:gene3195-3667_t
MEKSRDDNANEEDIQNKTGKITESSKKKMPGKSLKDYRINYGIISRITAGFTMLFQLFFCMFAWLIMILYIIIPISPFVFLFFVAKTIERKIYEALYDVEAVSSGDALWMQDKPTNLGIINTLVVFDGDVDVEDMREKFFTTMVDRKCEDKKGKGKSPYRRVKKHVTAGYFNHFWTEESDFNITDHVTKWPDTVTSKDALRHILSLLCSRPFEKGKSQWEFIVIPWVEGDVTKTAAMFRMHHSMADGVSLVNFMTSQLPDNKATPVPLNKYSEHDRLFMIAKGMFLSPIFLIKMLARKADDTLLHGKPLSGSKRITWSEPLDFSVVKRIKTATKTTVNDVVVSCLAATIREFFNERNLLPPQEVKVSLPVDLRKDIDEDAVEFENRFAILQLGLPTGISDPLAQLYEAKARMDELKFSGEPFSIGPTMDLLITVMPARIMTPIFRFVCEKTTGVFSNVPGPQNMIRVAGHDLETFTFWPPQKDNMGMSFSITSYNHKIFVGILSDSAILKDPHEICKEFHGQVKCLMNRLNIS